MWSLGSYLVSTCTLLVTHGLTIVFLYSCPQFEIVPEDDPQSAIVASSALTCHSNLLKAIASVRYRY